MTEQAVSKDFDPNRIQKVMRVKAPQAVAWRVFTEQMVSWWPLAEYKIGKAKAVDAVIEPRVGGRWSPGTPNLGRIGARCHGNFRKRVHAPRHLVSGHPRRAAI